MKRKIKQAKQQPAPPEQPSYLPDYVTVSSILTPEDTSSQQQPQSPHYLDNIASPKPAKFVDPAAISSKFSPPKKPAVPFFSQDFNIEVRENTPMRKERTAGAIRVVDEPGSGLGRSDSPLQHKHGKNPERELKSLLQQHRRQASTEQDIHNKAPEPLSRENTRAALPKTSPELKRFAPTAAISGKNSRLKRRIMASPMKRQAIEPFEASSQRNEEYLAQFLSARVPAASGSQKVLSVPRELRLSSKEEDRDLAVIHPKLFRNMFQHQQFKPQLSTQQSQKVLEFLLKEKVEPHGDVNQLILEHGLLSTSKEERDRAKSKEVALQNEKRGKLFGAAKQKGRAQSPLRRNKEDHLSAKKLFTQFVEDLEQTDKVNEQRRQSRAAEIKRAIESELSKFVPTAKKSSTFQTDIKHKPSHGPEREKKVHGAEVIKDAGGNLSALHSRTSKLPTQETSPQRSKVIYQENEGEHGEKELTIEIKNRESTTAQNFQRFLMKKKIHTSMQRTDSPHSSHQSRILITEEESVEDEIITRQVYPDPEPEQPGTVTPPVQRPQPQKTRPQTKQSRKSSKPSVIRPSDRQLLSPNINSPHQLPSASVTRISEIKRRHTNPMSLSYSQRPTRTNQKGTTPQEAYMGNNARKRPSTTAAGGGGGSRMATEPTDHSMSQFMIAAIKSRQSVGSPFESFYDKLSHLTSQQSSFHFSSSQNPRRHGDSFIRKSITTRNSEKRNNLLSVSQIIQKCDRSVADDGEEFRKKEVSTRAQQLAHFTGNLQRAVNGYIQMSHLNEKQFETMGIQNLVKEQVLTQAFDHQNFTSKEIIEKTRTDSQKCTMFINHLGKRKLWKPDRFIMSRKVRVAQTLEDLHKQL